jgi:hypothetical protein
VLAEAERACGHRAVEYVAEKSQIVPASARAHAAGRSRLLHGRDDIGRLAREFLEPQGEARSLIRA